MPLILTNAQVAQILHTLSHAELTRLTAALTGAFVAFSTQPSTVQQPLRTSLTTENGETTLFMPSAFDGTSAIKTVALGPDHPPRGTLTLLSATGELTAVLNAEEITGFRTALASILLLQRRTSEMHHAVVFGTGKQAEWAVRLLRKMFPGTCVTVVGRRTRGEALQKLPAQLGVECGAIGRAEEGAEAELQQLLAMADAVFCCTPSTEPLFPMDWLGVERRPVYVSLIGSYKPHMVEVEPQMLRSEGVAVVVDSIDACVQEAGELIQSGLGASQITEIGTVLNTATGGVEGSCIFKCVGLGVMDLVVGREIVRIAQARRVGVQVERFDD
jgi:ornithine cyclodeaminase/alanine dehydrogenase-like protein (mu-crystallin family)